MMTWTALLSSVNGLTCQIVLEVFSVLVLSPLPMLFSYLKENYCPRAKVNVSHNFRMLFYLFYGLKRKHGKYNHIEGLDVDNI